MEASEQIMCGDSDQKFISLVEKEENGDDLLSHHQN